VCGLAHRFGDTEARAYQVRDGRRGSATTCTVASHNELALDRVAIDQRSL